MAPTGGRDVSLELSSTSRNEVDMSLMLLTEHMVNFTHPSDTSREIIYVRFLGQHCHSLHTPGLQAKSSSLRRPHVP